MERRGRRLIAAALAAAALLTGCASANAAPMSDAGVGEVPSTRGVPFGELEQQLYEFAVAYMGEPRGCSSVTMERLDSVEKGILGQATLTVPGQPPVPCVLRLFVNDDSVFPGVMCEVTVHEVGHLDGLTHSSDPNSVMYPEHLGVSIPYCAYLEQTFLAEARLEEAWARWREWRDWCQAQYSGQRLLHCSEALRRWRERLRHRPALPIAIS